MIKTIVNGASGRMGQEAVKAVSSEKQFELVAAIGRNDNLETTIKNTKADIVIDFTRPEIVFNNVNIILNAGARAVIGTTGLTIDQITTLKNKCQELKRGCIIAPNFSIGAILLMKLTREIAPYFPDVEIIELHHTGKQDSPSGTAIKTAECIASVQAELSARPSAREIIPHARGAAHKGIHIHSVRLPGFVAHQEVIFGGEAETFTLRHDALSRQCFMPGLILACKKVMELKELVYGLENLI